MTSDAERRRRRREFVGRGGGVRTRDPTGLDSLSRGSQEVNCELGYGYGRASIYNNATQILWAAIYVLIVSTLVCHNCLTPYTNQPPFDGSALGT